MAINRTVKKPIIKARLQFSKISPTFAVGFCNRIVDNTN